MKTITMLDVRLSNGNWFSLENKRFFGDINYRLLTGKQSKNKYLVRFTTAWSDMFNQDKKYFYKINEIDQETLKIGSMFDPDFKNIDSVKAYLKYK